MANRYRDWSGQEIERLLMLDRKEGFVDEEIKEEFDRRCTDALNDTFKEICARYPNVIYHRGRRTRTPPG